MIGTILGFLSKPISSAIDYFKTAKEIEEKTRIIKVEGAQQIEKAKIGLKVSVLEAKAKEVATIEDNDAAYDMQVLKNRDNTFIDEILIFCYIILIGLHFVPYTQKYMLLGWKAMGYDGMPWWVEFGAVGILVSTLGLMRLFRMFSNTPTKLSVKPKESLF